MNKKGTAASACILLGMIATVSSSRLDLSDFLSGLLCGVGIALSVISIIVVLRATKPEKEEKTEE